HRPADSVGRVGGRRRRALHRVPRRRRPPLLARQRTRRGARAVAPRDGNRALRPLVVLRRLLRRSARLGGAGRGRRRLVAHGPLSPRRARRGRAGSRRRRRVVTRTQPAAGEGLERRWLEPASVWLLLAALGGIVLVAVPTLGAEPWQFRPGHVGPAGPFAWLVRATDGEWNVTALRAAGLLAGVIVALAAVVATVRARWPRWAAI